jgi:hypothetical protein
MSNVKYTRERLCEGCPCLNHSYEEGGECNLQYEVTIKSTKNKNTVYCSSDCGLEIVKHKNGEFKPVWVLVEDKGD